MRRQNDHRARVGQASGISRGTGTWPVGGQARTPAHGLEGRAAKLEGTWLAQLWLACMLALAVLWCPRAGGAELAGAAHFRKNLQPILEQYCSDCHADGMKKGGVVFDEFKSDDELLAKRDLWLAVLKNIRAGLMPPAKKAQP